MLRRVIFANVCHYLRNNEILIKLMKVDKAHLGANMIHLANVYNSKRHNEGLIKAYKVHVSANMFHLQNVYSSLGNNEDLMKFKAATLMLT